jgi:hypothetical protein
VLIVHQFRPADLDAARRAGDRRGWASALAANAQAFEAFGAALAEHGSSSRETEFVKSGTTLHVMKAQSFVETRKT